MHFYQICYHASSLRHPKATVAISVAHYHSWHVKYNIIIAIDSSWILCEMDAWERFTPFINPYSGMSYLARNHFYSYDKAYIPVIGLVVTTVIL